MWKGNDKLCIPEYMKDAYGLKRRMRFDDMEVLERVELLAIPFKGGFYATPYTEPYWLYLLKDGQKKDRFVVFAETFYISDVHYTEKGLHERVDYPKDLNIYKEFKSMGAARDFYEVIWNYVPGVTDLAYILDVPYTVAGFDSRDSVTKVTYNEQAKICASFEVEYIRHGYQRVCMRMHQFDKHIVLNKQHKLNFETATDCKGAFEALCKYYSTGRACNIVYTKRERDLNTALTELRDLLLRHGGKVQVHKTDELGRVVAVDYEMHIDDKRTNIHMRMATRNGHYHGAIINGEIHEIGGKFERYHHPAYMLRDIERLIPLVKAYQKSGYGTMVPMDVYVPLE